MVRCSVVLALMLSGCTTSQTADEDGLDIYIEVTPTELGCKVVVDGSETKVVSGDSLELNPRGRSK